MLSDVPRSGLRGGVHFMLQVDMQVLTKRAESL
jgi:hypothetical protein